MLGVKNIDLEYIDGRTKRTIFSDVSFDIHSGEFVSLLGPSGSGKSSLLYIVSLLKTPTAGEIYLDDVMISGAKNKNEIRYENFGFVFQHHFLIPHLTVLENVCTASYEKNVEKQAKDLLERLGLKDLMNQRRKQNFRIVNWQLQGQLSKSRGFYLQMSRQHHWITTQHRKL